MEDPAVGRNEYFELKELQEELTYENYMIQEGVVPTRYDGTGTPYTLRFTKASNIE